MAVRAVQEGMHTITPHLVVNDAAKALEFYKNAFGAQIGGVHYTPEGKVMHADFKIGDSKLMLADEFSGMSSPSTMPLANQFWGDRYGQVKDPFGHIWALGQHVEDVAPEEMEVRAREAFAHMAAKASA